MTAPSYSATELLDRAPVGVALLNLNGEVLAHNALLTRWIGLPITDLVAARQALVGRNVVELLAPSGKLLYETHIMPTLRTQRSVREMMVDTVDFTGVRRPVLFNAELIDNGSEPAYIALAVIEASGRASFERQLVEERQRADEATARLTVLQQALNHLAVAEGVDDLGRTIVDTASRASNAAYTALELSPVLHVGAAGPTRQWGTDPLEWDSSGQLEVFEPIVCHDPDELRRVFPDGAARMLQHGVEALCIVPLITHAADGPRRFGEIRCWFQRPRAIEDGITATLEALAAQVDLLLAHLSLQERIRHEARHDMLTGLPNRASLYERLVRILAYSSRTAEACSALFLDLDGFKAINDQLGHAEGDVVLQEISVRLRDACRVENSLARLGGDEFVVAGLMNASDAHELAQRVAAAIRAPLPGNAAAFPVSASIGVATWDPNDTPLAPEPSQLVDLADLAMYEAKRAGKDRTTHRMWGTDIASSLAEKISEYES